MYKDKFVLSVIHDGHPIKESGKRGNRQVAIPFGSEYKLRLKNKNDRSCTARITIDGTPVSNFGDIIVNAGGTVDLERFITNSMSSGKRFRFVDLDNPDVDDPTKSENGIVRVEFRLAKQKNGIKITPPKPRPPWNPPQYPWYEDNDGWRWGQNTWTVYNSDTIGSGDNYQNSSGKMKSSSGRGSSSVMYCASNVSSFCADTEAGATIEGGYSGQSFTYSDIEVESHATVLQLKIVGIRRGKRPVQGRYCTSCGHRIRRNDRYCGGCGRRI